MRVDPSVLLFFEAMIVAHIILLFIKPLRNRGIHSFIFGIYISVKTRHIKPSGNAPPKVFVYLSFCLIVLCYIMLFVARYLTIIIKLRRCLDMLIPEVVGLQDLLIFYVVTWGVAGIIGPFHEWMHFRFAMRSGIRVDKVGAIILMGFPLVFFVSPDLKNESDPYKKMVVVAGGLIANAVVLGLVGLLYLILRSVYLGILLTLVLLIFIGNIIPYHAYVKVDGVIFLEYLIEKIAKKHRGCGYILQGILYAVLLGIIFFILYDIGDIL